MVINEVPLKQMEAIGVRCSAVSTTQVVEFDQNGAAVT